MSVVQDLKDKLRLDQNLIPITFLCLIIILGATLRFYDLGAESYWFDEVIMVHVAQGSLASILIQARGGRPPVYVVLAHFWMHVFGTNEAATRSLSALAGIVSIAVMYTVGRALFGRKVGLLSALLMAISDFQIHYSQEYRYYSVFLLMTLVSFLFCIRALRSRRLSHFVLYVLASILLFYSHTYGVFVLVAQSLYFLLQWNRYRRMRAPWLLCQTLILLAIAPGLLVAMRGTVAGAYGPMVWIPDPPLWLPLKTLLRYVFPGFYGLSWVTLLVTLVAGMAFFVIGTWLFANWKGKERWLASVAGLATAVQDLSSRANELRLVGCWLLCPLVLPFVLSKVFGPMYVQKYTISASAAFYLLLALGITTVGKVVPEFISLGLLVILIAPGLRQYYVVDVNEQWRETVAYVEENARKGDVIIFAPDEDGWQGKCFYWYYRGNLPECGIAREVTDGEAIADALERCTSSSERFWLIMRGSPKTMGRFRAFFLDRGHEAMRLLREEEFEQVSVYLFAMKR